MWSLITVLVIAGLVGVVIGCRKLKAVILDADDYFNMVIDGSTRLTMEFSRYKKSVDDTTLQAQIIHEGERDDSDRLMVYVQIIHNLTRNMVKYRLARQRVGGQPVLVVNQEKDATAFTVLFPAR